MTDKSLQQAKNILRDNLSFFLKKGYWLKKNKMGNTD